MTAVGPRQPGPGQIILPMGQWIPNIDQITHSAAGLLAVVGDTLDQFGLGEGFDRKYYTHGELVPIVPSETVDKQLIVSFLGLELGDAGRKQFQYQNGDIGSFAHMTGEFLVQLWTKWPVPEGGIVASLPQTLDMMEAADLLNSTGWVAFSALRALALNGIRIDPPVTPIQQDGIMVGPMKPLGPQGGLAGWGISVQLQYS